MGAGEFAIKKDKTGDVVAATLYGLNGLKKVELADMSMMPPDLLRYHKSLHNMVFTPDAAQVMQTSVQMEDVKSATAFCIVDCLDVFKGSHRKVAWVTGAAAQTAAARWPARPAPVLWLGHGALVRNSHLRTHDETMQASTR